MDDYRPIPQTVEFYCNGSSGDQELELKVAGAMRQAFDLWKVRHAKYGRGNISMFGAAGCLVRSGDKIARLTEVYMHGKKDTPDESIADSWMDLGNYSFMGLLCHRGEW